MDVSGNSSVAFELNHSQNPFNNADTRNTFLRGVFLLYTFTHLPALICLIVIQTDGDFKYIVKKHIEFAFVGAFIVVITGYVLGFSRFVARKFPLNYILYTVFIASFTTMAIGIAGRYAPANIYIICVMLMSAGIAQFFYVLVVKSSYKGYIAFLASAGVLLINLLVFGLVYKSKIYYILIYFAAAFVLAALISFGAQAIVENRGYDLLKDDYILVALKLVTIFPLLPHITGDRDDYMQHLSK